ncbi:phosphoribosyl-AMP cyclohydrolase [Leifsonia shinshuensis]|uniref:phosphoribosyl-AMP cyclohydrolase n=1 Tax=Leifsonia shinshuensis TaxID=150026 RepID=UPI001F5087F2|nr:phosphoribosyl-AMP cyclohydrolase [Leifsonia shinshuensis]MCI0155661.1 phosphoribosyl-AMP cyclohydrolase [Leifsonia shinshuensis]
MTATDDVIGRIRFNEAGLVPAVIQQWDSREVLMMGWMDAEAVRRTLGEGRVTFWSRSRQEYWRKGDTSGHVQYVKGAALDCDGDTLLVTVEQVGAACHTGTRTCFDADVLEPVVADADSARLAAEMGSDL